ncbi:MAG: anti-sigma factor family protein [Armatimonadota bacterium]
MECLKVQEKLGFYLDEVLDERSLELIEAHLAECDACRQELSTMRMLVEAANEIESVEPPTGLRESILQAAKSQERTAQPLENATSRLSFGDWLKSYASPKGLRWAAGAVAAGTVALAILIASPHETMQTRQAAVQVQKPAQTAAPVAVQPKTTSVAESAAVDTIQQSRATVEQKRQIRAASWSTHSHARRHVVKHYKLVASKPATSAPVIKKSAAVVARVDARAEHKIADQEVSPDTSSSTAETTEVATVSEPNKSTKAEIDKPMVVRIAAAPVLNNDKIHEWMRNAKVQAEMRKGVDRGTAVSIVSARF